MNKIIALGVLASAFVAVPSMAATDGQLSEQSSVGTLQIQTVIPKMVRISGLTDIAFNITAASVSNESGRQNKAVSFCVYSNDTVDGLYKMRVDGLAGDQLNTGENKFALSANGNGATGTLSHAVWVSDNASDVYGRGTATPGVERNFKTTSGGQARPTTLSCNGASNAALNVGIPNKNILAATAGTYAGTLTLTVSTL